jgi:hypothetical protein
MQDGFGRAQRQVVLQVGEAELRLPEVGRDQPAADQAIDRQDQRFGVGGCLNQSAG